MVRLDWLAVRLPVDALVRKKHVVTYRDRTPGARIGRLRLDLRKRRFLVTGDGWALAGLPTSTA